MVAIVALAALVLGTVERALRWKYPDKVIPPRADRAELAFVDDPELVVRLKPGVQKVFRRSAANGGHEIRWQTNSQGFRGEELDASAEFRVVVFGDSNILARYTALPDTFPEQLEKILNQNAGSRIEVVNAGVTGYGPDQVLLRMKRDLPGLAADLVIVNIFADNDFGDLIRNRIFTLDDVGRLTKTTLPGKPDEHLHRAPPSLRERISQLLIVRAASALLRVGSALKFHIGLVQMEYEVYRRGLPRQFSNFADRYEFDLALDPTSESSRTKLSLMEAVLKEIGATADAFGLPVMVLVEPSASDLTDNYEAEPNAFGAIDAYRPTALTDAAEAAARAAGLPVLNLFEAFAAADPERLYFQVDDNHWNEAGQRLAAEEAAQFLRANDWVPEALPAPVASPK